MSLIERYPKIYSRSVVLVNFFLTSRYDIPVLHIDDVYWAKHRLTPEEAVEGIGQSCQGQFQARAGEPDASRLEHNS